jgi:hypothetical protein
MQSYFLDLATLLQILSRQKQSGVLQAENIRLPGIKQSAGARLILEQGNIRSCTLSLKMGTLSMPAETNIAEGSKAMQMLYELETLEWRWTAASSLTTQKMQITRAKEKPPVPPVEFSPLAMREFSIPRRTAGFETTMLDTLPRNYRRILALVDGKRPVSKIAAMLAMPEEELRKTCNALRSLRLITWDNLPSE